MMLRIFMQGIFLVLGRAHLRLLALACALVLLGGCALAQTAPTITLPAALAYDSNGNLFIADSTRNQVLELTVGGDVVLVAGTGAQGFGGDGGAASVALLNQPRGLAVGPEGTIYIADTGNRRIRAVTDGVISTIAGSGNAGDSGDGGPATTATFGKPTSLASAGPVLLVCDAANHRVRRIASGTIQAFAGSGVQGFSGDGATASAAQLDSPQAIAVLADGRVLISDSHNNRIRVVTTDGTISTFAGNGVAGYSGDGGPAIAAKLSQPRALSVLAGGAVLVADSNNQRVRIIDSSGVITTLAGTGRQGSSQDADAAVTSDMNLPRGLAVSPYGNVTVGDSSTPTLKAVALNGNFYLVPAPLTRASKVTLVAGKSAIYGQTSASVIVTAVNPQGHIEITDSGSVIGSGSLASGALDVALPQLSATNHVLIAKYGGDGLNTAAASLPVAFAILPAPVTATAINAAITYGQPLPTLTGTLSGVLPQDTGNVQAVFSSSAIVTSDAGDYPITASLSGPASGNYGLTNSSSAGTLTIRKAKTTTSIGSLSQASYAGLPLSLRATVAPEFAGDPAGEVDFMDGSTLVARARTANGTATATYLSPSAGAHSVIAAYLGGNNFAASSSGPVTVNVGALPDFTVQAASSNQSVQAGLIASYGLTVSPQGGAAFTGSVTFSVSGLPSGALATFSPAAVVPGSTGASTTLSIQTPVRRANADGIPGAGKWVALVPLLLVLRRRRWRGALIVGFVAMLLLGAAGCGDRTVGSPTGTVASQSYSLVVTATSTNLAGSVVTHTVPLTLTVQGQ